MYRLQGEQNATFLKTKCHAKLLSMVSGVFAAVSSETYTTASHDIWFLRNWHIVLPEEGTQVTKRVGEIYLTYVYLVGIIKKGVR